MKITETSFIGQVVLDSGTDAVIIGISINNSYFKEDNIEKLLLWARKTAKSIYIMIPDEPSVHTLEALGMPQSKTVKIARLKSNALENKCKSIISRYSIPNVYIIRWDFVTKCPDYFKSIALLMTAYNNDPAFRSQVQATTEKVLASHLKGGAVSEGMLSVGVNFLFKELAFICCADKILNVRKVAYVYHKTMPLLLEIIEGVYSYKASAGVGFIIVE